MAQNGAAILQAQAMRDSPQLFGTGARRQSIARTEGPTRQSGGARGRSASR
jgi:hypothetical protein